MIVNFQWGIEIKAAFMTAGKLFFVHAFLTSNKPDDNLIMDIIFNGELTTRDSWEIQKKNLTNIYFWDSIPRTSLIGRINILPEKQIWKLYEVWRTLYLVFSNHHMIVRAPLTMIGWILFKAESFTGLAMEGKILQWKLYLSEFLHDQFLCGSK